MKTRKISALVAIAAFTLLTSGAGAQNATGRERNAGTTLLRSSPIRVDMSISIQVPKAGEGMEEQARQSEAVRKLFYEAAQRECTLLKDLFKAECQLRSIRVNASVQTRSRDQDALNVSGQANYEVFERVE